MSCPTLSAAKADLAQQVKNDKHNKKRSWNIFQMCFKNALCITRHRILKIDELYEKLKFCICFAKKMQLTIYFIDDII